MPPVQPNSLVARAVRLLLAVTLGARPRLRMLTTTPLATVKTGRSVLYALPLPLLHRVLKTITTPLAQVRSRFLRRTVHIPALSMMPNGVLVEVVPGPP